MADDYLRLRSIIVSTRAALTHDALDQVVIKARGVQLLDALAEQVRADGADPTVLAMIVVARADLQA